MSRERVIAPSHIVSDFNIFVRCKVLSDHHGEVGPFLLKGDSACLNFSLSAVRPVHSFNVTVCHLPQDPLLSLSTSEGRHVDGLDRLVQCTTY